MINRDERLKLLVLEAHRWVGVKEENGDNRGQIVEMFQRAADKVAIREPWCMSFIQYCLKQADNIALNIFRAQGTHNLFVSEHCLTVWNKSPQAIRISEPVVGSIAIWRLNGSQNGHAGIVVEVGSKDFKTIEGNTGQAAGIQREGDGVYIRARTKASSSNFELLGFLLPY